MSLVENLARRQHSPLDLMREIGALRERGYSMAQIAAKTDFSEEYVSAICYLLDHGESRLLTAVDRGVIPATIAMEIARATDADVQAALTEAYERKALPGNQVLAIRRIIEQRRATGKAIEPWRTRQLTEPKAGLGRLVGPVLPEGDAAAEAADQEGDAESDAPAVRRQRLASSPGRRELRHAAAGRGHADVCLGRSSSG